MASLFLSLVLLVQASVQVMHVVCFRILQSFEDLFQEHEIRAQAANSEADLVIFPALVICSMAYVRALTMLCAGFSALQTKGRGNTGTQTLVDG